MSIKQGRLRGDKVQFKDGIGCCVWYPIPLASKKRKSLLDEECGICFDFPFKDIDDFIKLLELLKEAKAENLESSPKE